MNDRGELDFDTDRAVAQLMRFLAVEGITGQEQAIGKEVCAALLEAGVPKRAMQFDHAHEAIPLPTQTGNLIVNLPGNSPGPRRLFLSHLDTVPPCAGVKPLRKGNRIVAAGETALGGDNRTGVACLVTMATTLLERQLPHPPLTLLFTVREESGLWGARHVDKALLREPEVGFNFDGRLAEQFTIGAVGAERWQVEILGQAAHAGVHPEQGISASIVASLALASVYAGGWFGKVKQGEREGTSNIGSFGGRDGRSAGEATNVVTDYVLLHGESRSHDPRFVKEITSAYRQAFRVAAAQVRDHRGKPARARFQAHLDYHPFRLKPGAPIVSLAEAAAKRAGLQPSLRTTNGGLDANWLVRHGIPTITFGAGQNNIHTIGEFVEIPEFLKGCRLALALATQA